jgi:hypothetical protein
MYVKIKGAYVKLAFLLPLVIICLSYGCLGRSLAVFYHQNNSFATTILLATSFAGIYVLRFSLGGILATVAGLVLTFIQAGVLPGIVAIAIAALVLWLGLYDVRSQSDTSETNLNTLEWWQTLITVALSISLTMVILQAVSSFVAGLWTGALAGALAVFGVQVQTDDIGTDRPQYWLMLGACSCLAIGIIFGSFTYSTPNLF